MNMTSYEKGEERGRRNLVQILLKRKFKQLPDRVAERVDGMSVDEIIDLIEKLPQANSLQDLGLEN